MVRQVKICGVRDRSGFDACLVARPDYVGFNFAPASRRRVDPATVSGWIGASPDDAPVAVGVFVDQPAGDVMRIARSSGVAVIQLHGDEPPAYCSALGGFAIWKAVSGPDVTLGRLREYAAWCDTLIVDGRRPGSGESWDHARVRSWLDEEGCIEGVPVFVAGGLGPDLVAEVLVATGAAGADVASGVETNGVVDADKVAAFVAAVRGVRG